MPFWEEKNFSMPLHSSGPQDADPSAGRHDVDRPQDVRLHQGGRRQDRRLREGKMKTFLLGWVQIGGGGKEDAGVIAAAASKCRGLGLVLPPPAITAQWRKKNCRGYYGGSGKKEDERNPVLSPRLAPRGGSILEEQVLYKDMSMKYNKGQKVFERVCSFPY